MSKNADFPLVFERLRTILQKYESWLALTSDVPGNYSLDAGYSEKFKRVIFFGAVQIKKNYVSFHLMPVYVRPELLDGISADLRKRMQGKSCFNFTGIDEALFQELAVLAEKGFEAYQAVELV